MNIINGRSEADDQPIIDGEPNVMPLISQEGFQRRQNHVVVENARFDLIKPVLVGRIGKKINDWH